MTSKFTPLALSLLLAGTLSAQTFQDSLVLQMDFDGNFNAHGNTALIANTNEIDLTADNFGRANRAVQFSGDSGLITLPDTSALHLQFPVTISLWAYVDTVQGEENFIHTSADSAKYAGFSLGLHGDGSGKIVIGTGDGRLAGSQYRRTFVTNDSIKAGAWHHYVAIFNGPTDMAVYVDGQSWAGEHSGTGLTTVGYTGAPVRIGNEHGAFGGRTFLKGALDEIRIWSRGFDQEEAIQLYNGEGMISYIPMDIEALDKSRFGIDPEFSAIVSEDRNDNAGGAMAFDGLGEQVVQWPESDTFEIQPPFTLAMWVYVDRLDTNTNIFVDTDDNHTIYTGFNIGLTSGTGQVSMSTGDGRGAGSQFRRTFISDSSKITAGNWHHLVAVVNSATDMEAWVDGESLTGVHSGSGLTTIAYSEAPMRLGTNGGPWSDPYNFAGKLDEFRFYDFAISPEMIDRIYEPIDGGISTEIPELSANTLTLYPNPANSVVNIKGYAGNVQSTIYNALGETVRSGQEIIDVSNLVNGVYFVTIEDMNGTSVKKLVKR